MRLLKFLKRKKPQSSQPGRPAQSAYPGNSGGSAPQIVGQGCSTSPSAFQALIERSITAWNSLSYVDETEEMEASFKLHADILKALRSLDDLLESRVLFWFFHQQEYFARQDQFLKWDPSRLDEYVLLPVAPGFVNKADCFYVSHFWRAKEHPDPEGEDFRLIRGDLAGVQWKYVWVDWTCLPQSPHSAAQEKYFTKMLSRSATLMRECAFTWRYPTFQPRLWILVEVGLYMLTATSYEVTPDMKPFVDDILAMKKEGVRQVIRERGYTCTLNRDYRLLVGWLELTIILSHLVADVAVRRELLDSIDMPGASKIEDYLNGIKIDKSTGIVSRNKSVYRFVPLWPVGEDGLPEVVTEPGALEPPACVDQVIAAMQHPELIEAKRKLEDSRSSLGADHADTIASASELADVFMKLEQYKEGEEIYHQALTSIQKTLGPEHRHAVGPTNKLAEAVIGLKKFKEAEELRRRALAILQDTLGQSHPQTLEAIRLLGMTLQMQKRDHEASKLFQQYYVGESRYDLPS